MQGSLFDESDPSLCRLPRTTSRSRVTSPQSRADEGQHLGDPLRQRWRASVTLRLTTIVAVVFCSLMGFIAYFTKAELERQFSGSLVVRANRVIDAIESVQPNLELPVFLSVYRDYLVLPPDTAVNPRFADLKLAPMSDLERQAFATDRTTDALDDDKRYTLRPGDVFWTGVGSVHAFYNTSQGTVRWLETQSRNTHENAVRSAAILTAAKISRIVLVAHSFDMPRARAEFAAQGIDAIPAPTGIPSGRIDSALDVLPSMEGLQGSYFALYEICANAVRWIVVTL